MLATSCQKLGDCASNILPKIWGLCNQHRAKDLGIVQAKSWQRFGYCASNIVAKIWIFCKQHGGKDLYIVQATLWQRFEYVQSDQTFHSYRGCTCFDSVVPESSMFFPGRKNVPVLKIN